MKTLRPALLAVPMILALALFQGCDRDDEPETHFTGDFDEAEMDAAMEAARAHVDELIAVLQAGDAENLSIKVAVEDGDDREFFWTSDVTYANGKFTAKIGNDPGLVDSVALGDSVTVGKDEISDWLYLRDGRMHGNYTLRVMLPGMEPAEAEMWQSRMAPLPE